ncbi:MAG: DinB family protein [Planctomycetota bacterium]|jgi:flavin reductase (DIM6/NTAB) family NADH-FMN oxidoreductase RutF/uncharacterized damage-inducible protein DinB
MLIDPGDLDARQLYRLMTSVVVPRPIAWTSTVSADGVLNAAPFSYFQALSSRPPMVMLAIGRRRGVPKDTRANIEATREFVINIVSEELGPRMVMTSIEHPPEISEFEEVGLTPMPSERVAPPRIAESAVSLECRLDRLLEVGTSGICIGEVVLFHLRDDVLGEDRTADPLKLRPLGRLGGTAYAPLREVVEITQEGTTTTVDGEMLAFWRQLRGRTVAMVKALEPEHLERDLGGGGDSVGRIVRHIAGCTAWLRLRLLGREEEDTLKGWDSSWTPPRLVEELESDGREFEAAIRVSQLEAREMLRLAIRHEAWHQGQLAAALRDAFEPLELWRL